MNTRNKIVKEILKKYEQCGEIGEDGEAVDAQQSQGTFADGLLYAVRIIQRH